MEHACIQNEVIESVRKDLKLNDEKTMKVDINLKVMQKELHDIHKNTGDIKKSIDDFILSTNKRFEQERLKSNERYAPITSYKILVWFAKLVWWAVVIALLWAFFKIAVI